MASRRAPPEVFSTAFLDLLSCGMGAVIILMITFLSRISVDAGDSTAYAIVSLEVALPPANVSFGDHLTVNGAMVCEVAGADLRVESTPRTSLPLGQSRTFGPFSGVLDGLALSISYDSSVSAYVTVDDVTYSPPPFPAGAMFGTEYLDYYATRTYTLTMKQIEGTAEIRLRLDRSTYVDQLGGDVIFTRAGERVARWDTSDSGASFPPLVRVSIAASTKAQPLAPIRYYISDFLGPSSRTVVVRLDEELELSNPVWLE